MSDPLTIKFAPSMPAATVDVVSSDLEIIQRLMLEPGRSTSVHVPSEASFLRVHLPSGEVVTLKDPGKLPRKVSLQTILGLLPAVKELPELPSVEQIRRYHHSRSQTPTIAMPPAHKKVIEGPVKLTLSGSTNANTKQAILTNSKFTEASIELGDISFMADTDSVSLKPETVGGASVSFEIATSAHSGMGVYDKSAHAINRLNFVDPPDLKIADVPGQRYLLMEWGYSASFSGSASHPVGLLGTASFGVDEERNSVFAVLHRFDANQGSHDVIEDLLASWRLPRQVEYAGGDINVKPGTWLLVEADGSLALTVASSLDWNISFAKDAKLLGVTHNLSARVDAGLKATLGFTVSGKYILVVGREKADAVVRLRLFKQSTRGLDFGFNLTVGMQGAGPQLPANFDDFIKSVFGVHGLQVLNDLREWTDPSTDLGQKLAGLADQTALDLLKSTTGIDPAADFNKAKQIVADALNTWFSLPDELSSMMWNVLKQQAGAGVVANFKAFLTGLADPATGPETLANALQKATFGDTWEGQFLEAVADRGLLELANRLGLVSIYASKVSDVLNGGIIAKLQSFINQKLNLDQIRNAASDADFNKIEQWLQNRLGNFLDKTLGLDDLKDIQKAIKTLDTKVGDYYKTGVQAVTKRYSIDFAATYQSTTTDTALIDVNFDLSVPDAAALFSDIVRQSNLDNLLTRDTNGVMVNQAKLTHDIHRKATIDLHMPLFDFTSTHVNDAIVTLTGEEQGGRLLLYQIDAQDKVTVANRATSQLSVLASLKVAPGHMPRLDADGSITYEMRRVKADMRLLDLESLTLPFIRQYLGGLFIAGGALVGGFDTDLNHVAPARWTTVLNALVRGFYTDLNSAVGVLIHNPSNHLGDMAVSMQLSLSATVLSGWFQLRSASQLRADQMLLSRALQSAWKNLLPALYFTDLDLYQFDESVAALLVWSSLPISTGISFDDPTINQFNTDRDVFWDWPDVDLRGAIARDPHTMATLGAHLSRIQTQLLEAASGNAGFFASSKAGDFVELALNPTGDTFLSSLLFTEARLVRGATDALTQVAAALNTAATAPTQAIKTLAKFAADLTDTFNHRVASVYSGMSGRLVGPMLLVESSTALGSPGAKPAAMLALYTLNPGHTFDLGKFIDGAMPPQSEVAITQTLVSLE